MSASRSVLVTGASGFIGRALIADLAVRGYHVRAASRVRHAASNRITPIDLPDLAGDFDAAPMVDGVDAVVHLAGLAHASSKLPESHYAAINAEATRRLALAARNAGVAAFVLMSSVRAQCGPSSASPLNEAAPPRPTDAYGRSKLAAELAVENAVSGSPTRWAALRPPLVYGSGVKGNMAALMRVARLPVPLPLGRLTGRRSLVSVGNLAGAVVHTIEAAPPSGVYLVADDGAVTASEIITALRAGVERRAGLFAAPKWMLRGLGGGASERLLGDLVVDAGKLKKSGWTPTDATLPALAALARSDRRH